MPVSTRSVTTFRQDPPEPFTKTDHQAYRDNVTGLEWGKHINIHSHAMLPEMHVTDFYNTYEEVPNPEYGEPEHPDAPPTIIVPPPGLEFAGPLVYDEDGEPVIDPDTGEQQRIMHTDWRPPTIGELLEAIDHGLLEYLYLDFSYDEGAQPYGEPKPEGYDDLNLSMYPPNAWGDDDYWSICIEKHRGYNRRYKFRFTQEMELDYWMQSGAGWHIAVRGKAADHSNCPGRHYKPPKPGKPKQ
jgi:hypothetical protein